MSLNEELCVRCNDDRVVVLVLRKQSHPFGISVQTFDCYFSIDPCNNDIAVARGFRFSKSVQTINVFRMFDGLYFLKPQQMVNKHSNDASAAQNVQTIPLVKLPFNSIVRFTYKILLLHGRAGM